MGRKKNQEEQVLIGEFPAVRLKAPKGATGISVDGEEYEVGEDGHIVVPAHAEATLKDHGYTDEDEDAAA